MAPIRTNANETPFGKWLERHGIEYPEAAQALGITRERVRQLAQRKYPSLIAAFAIKDWTKSVDPDDFIEVEDWREVVMTSSEMKEMERARAEAKTKAIAAADPVRPRKSRLRR